MNVLLVTTWEIPCGIAEHSAMLKDAVEASDPTIQITPSALALDPTQRNPHPPHQFDILHLNYQASLHSRWTPEVVREAKASGEYKAVVITYHDTGVPNSDQCKALCAVADAVIVHEPFDDLPLGTVQYWRMGVPAPRIAYQFGKGHEVLNTDRFKAWWGQPVLGTIGFAFPWKNYDRLAEVTAAMGWALLIIAPDASPDQVKAWYQINPALCVYPEFVDRGRAISLLGGCDATAFLYVCHNTGQSGAVLQGIAARKPVIALKTCRQFRALYADPLGRATIKWAETFEDVAAHLRNVRLQRCDPGIVALAEQESWTHLGAKYAALYQRLIS